MENFEILGLNNVLNKSLKKMGFISPTPIQSKAIPLILSGKDILGSASTGTGKTGAFAIPVIEKILNSKEHCALIVTPTRELAKQVIEVFRNLLGNSNPVKACCLIGGEAIGKQLNQLKRKPRIIVGTPGRINDHLEKRSLSLMNSVYLVLDETDRMLDMGFGIQIDQILKFMPNKKQTLMFSATLPKNIVNLATKYLIKPEKITMNIENSISKNIKHEVIHVDNAAKYKTLLAQLEIRDGAVLVFAKTKHSTEKIAKNLKKDGIKSNALNGDLRQSKRNKVMRGFKENQFKVLVATDIASRGLDVPHLKHVINYDLPQVAEDYIHRIGRTARAGANGEAICFVSPNEGHLWINIDTLVNPDAKNSISSRRGVSNKRNSRKKVKSKFKTSENSGKKYKGKSKFKKSEKDEKKFKGKKRSASKKTIRSSDAKPKKRFYPAKKKKVR